MDIGTAAAVAATGINPKNFSKLPAPTADRNAKYLLNPHRDVQSTARIALRSTSQKITATGAEDSEFGLCPTPKPLIYHLSSLYSRKFPSYPF